MPLGFTMGGRMPRFCGRQSWFEYMALYSRTSASVRGSPTLNCTVSTPMPGRDTE